MIYKNVLPIQLDARFARYALLTGAAILAAKPAKASVVFTAVTPTDFTAGVHTLDVNGDGFNDYVFSGVGGSQGAFVVGNTISFFEFVTFSGCCGICCSSFSQSERDMLVLDPTNSFDVMAFGTGATIGSGVSYVGCGAMADFSATGPLFMGLQFFDTNGAIHYGFAEFDPWNFDGFAFELLPDTSITTFDVNAPEPGSLGMLALGAAGLEILRRKRANRA